MRINKAISEILKTKNLTKESLSKMLGKEINVRDKLSTANLTINSILELITPIGYELILQPCDAAKHPYQTVIDNNDLCSPIVVYLKSNVKSIRKTTVDNQEYYVLEDICDCLGIKLNSIYNSLSDSKRLIVVSLDRHLQVLHLVSKEDMNYVCKQYALSDFDLSFEEITINTKDYERNPKNSIETYIDECCVIDISKSTDCYTTYANYLSWSNENNIKPFPQSTFDEIIRRKFVRQKDKYWGIGLSYLEVCQ